MRAIIATEKTAGIAGLRLTEQEMPAPSLNDVIVQVYAASTTGDELSWPSTWVDRAGKDRTPSIPGHELSGVVTALGYGTTGLSIGQRVLGLADWHRNGSLAEYVAVEARNLAPLPDDIDFSEGAAMVMPGLTAWQGLFIHGELRSGQRVLIHGAAGIVGSMAVQLAREAGAYVLGSGRESHRQSALNFGAHEFIDLDKRGFQSIDEVNLVFDVLGGDIGRLSVEIIQPGGRLVTVTGPMNIQSADRKIIDFVVEADRKQLMEIVRRFREGKIKTLIGSTATLDTAISTYNSGNHVNGKIVIRVR